MKDLPKLACEYNCERVLDCHFGVQGSNPRANKILIILNNPYEIITQQALFENSYKSALFKTKTGLVLSEILEYCNLSVEDITITNLFKGILQKNVSPNTEEYKKCHNNLINQIKTISPRRIIIFGYQGKKLLEDNYDLQKRKVCFMKHPSWIWAKTITKKEKRQPYREKIKNFLEN